MEIKNRTNQTKIKIEKRSLKGKKEPRWGKNHCG